MATGLNNLKIYNMACDLELEVFNLTKDFPQDERFRSIDQLRRSSSSVTNNIAEAYNKRSQKDKIRILSDIVKGEAEETKTNLIMCYKKGFHNNESIPEKYTELLKAVSGYIRFVRSLGLNNLPTNQLKN